MKFINKIGMMVVAGMALATTSCSDFSDYNTVPVADGQSAGNTLYENIKSNENLQQFAAIVDKARYANVLNASQNYTMWLPADGTYDAQEILKGDSATIVNRFIKQHMALFSYPVTGTVYENVVTMNDKHHLFTNDFFDTHAIKKANIPASNGMMHIIDGPSVYRSNIYQHLSEIKDCDKIVKEIKSYADSVIDKSSVPGPMVNGQQTYLDTVWHYTNPIIENVLQAEISNEDSSYLMLMPTDKAWDKAYAEIKKDFVYSTKDFKFVDVSDNSTVVTSITPTKVSDPVKDAFLSKNKVVVNAEALSDSITKSFIMRNLVFSLNDKYNEKLIEGTMQDGDTLRSTTYTKLSNVEEILRHCSVSEEMSNGYVSKLDELCFKSYETYEPVISSYNPIRVLGLKSTSNYKRWRHLQSDLWPRRDTLFSKLPDFLKMKVLPKNSIYTSYISTDSLDFASAISKPELAFPLNNVLAKKYKIFVVFSPISHGRGEVGYVKNLPLYVRFDLAYNEADGTPKSVRINVPGARAAADIVIPGDGKFNYVEMEFEFPVSYYGLTVKNESEGTNGRKVVSPTLFISHTKSFVTAINKRTYEQELRVQGVYLVPEGAYDYVNNLKFEYENK